MFVPAIFIRWFGPTAARIVAGVLVGALAVGLLVGLYVGVKDFFAADLTARVKVITNQLGASRESAKDAIETTQDVAGNEQAIDTTTRENAVVIEKSKGADAAIDPAVRAAGLHALCARKSYRESHPACLQRAAP